MSKVGMEYGRPVQGHWNEVKKRGARGYRSDDDTELLVFGYSCKLFRDDEKALYIDNEEHLIPWMGNSALMIDRFDVRGALYDLAEAESRGLPFAETATEVEVKEEELCEQERYLALYHDETLQQLYQEEETKRLETELTSEDGSYNQVGFDYMASLYSMTSQHLDCANETVVHPPPPSQEPVSYNPSSDEDVFIPPPELNVPLGIEVPKTVKQNKIIMKTAKFIVTQGAQMEILIKTKQAGNPMFNFLAFDNPLNAYYKHVVHMIRNGRYRWDDEPTVKSEENDQYLHPNLSQSVRPDLTPGVAASPSRPSPHCSYTKLISNIREKQKATAIDDADIPSPLAPASPVNAHPEAVTPKTEVTQTPVVQSEPIVGLVDYPSFNQTADGGSDMEENEPSMSPVSRKGIVKGNSSRIQSHDYSNIKWPPPEIQMVIDKMASYITKNGPAFEEVVKSRDDSRFEFLKENHEYHPYYQCKIELYNEVYGDIFKHAVKIIKGRKSPEKKGAAVKKEIEKSRTISFSIKSREQDVSVTSHTTFPIESSTSEEDEDMEEEEKERRKQEREKRRQARRAKAEKEKKEREEIFKRERLKREKEEEEKRRLEKGEESSSGNEDLYDIFKYAQEMERDKSARAVSPDDMASNTKQEERKKKAVAFISKLKDTSDEKKSKPITVYGPQLPPELAVTVSRSVTQSPTSSRASSDGGDKAPPPLPPPRDRTPPPPPPPTSASPVGLSEALTSSLLQLDRTKSKSKSRERSATPTRAKLLSKDKNISSMASILLAGINDMNTPKQSSHKRLSESEDKVVHKSRSHKKHARQRSESRSPSSRRERKKRKKSHYRHKKHRSRSRSRSRGHSKSHRSSHKKKQKQSSHRDRDKSSHKRKHRRHHSPSSASSLPSSDSSSPSTPSTLPSESESEVDVQVIESDDEESKVTSRGSSVVSLPPVMLQTPQESKSNGVKSTRSTTKAEGYGSGDESSQSLPPVRHAALSLFQAEENTNSSDVPNESDKKSAFNPSKSTAMAKIAQGLRAKLNALLEKESKMD